MDRCERCGGDSFLYEGGYWDIYEWKENHYSRWVKDSRTRCSGCAPTEEEAYILRLAALNIFTMTKKDLKLRERMAPTMLQFLSEAGAQKPWKDGLVDLGYLAEIHNRIQAERKRLGLEFSDRVDIVFESGPRIDRLLHGYGEEIRSECLIRNLQVGPVEDSAITADIEGDKVRFQVSRV